MKHFEHRNILPVYGVSTTIAPFCLVYPWYGNGNIVEYLRKEPDVNRFDLASASRQISYSRRLPASTNSYRMRLTGCAMHTIILGRTVL